MDQARQNAPGQRPEGQRSDQVKTCQIGYLPHETKFAMLTDAPAGAAVVRRAADGGAVLTVKAAPPVQDADSGDAVSAIDFSALAEPGAYFLEVPGVGLSDEFQVGPDIFARPFRLAMRMFTGQRCGTPVSLAPDFPEYHYPVCHTAPAEFHPSSGQHGQWDCQGGWHDAGDYGRYTVNSGITTGTLLWAYELNQDKLRAVGLDLPESGGPTPDVLAEIRWNVAWMLRMQDGDGGAWHKATTARFPGFVMPQDDADPVLIIGHGEAPYKTTAATADLAAVCAIAARLYRPFDAAFAGTCLRTAERAWGWLASTPDHNFTDNPPGIATGGYGDDDARDERLWAASELFRTTGGGEYGEYFLSHHGAWQPALNAEAPPSWPDVSALAMFSYALTDGADLEAVAGIKADALTAADAIAARSQANGYRVPMTAQDYIWGSNAVVANYALVLLFAGRFTPKAEYRNAALDALHYLLGRNTFGISFVTQVGCRWPMHPHHRPSGADGVEQPWPGMLVGGPNAEGRTPPARQWADEEGSYTTNEVAINWNAPLVFLLAHFLP